MTAAIEIPRWERTTKELLFVTCAQCCRRFEVEMGNDGTASTLPYLYEVYAHHLLSHLVWPYTQGQSKAIPSFQQFKRLVRVEDVGLYEPLDLSDIISKRSLERRALRYARSHGLTIERATALIEERIRHLVAMEDKYACRKCGKPISRVRARRGGIGKSHPGGRGDAGVPG